MGSVQAKLNIPEELHAALKSSAAANRRSLNAEIIHRCDPTLNDEAEMSGKKTATITIRLSEEKREQLRTLAERGPYQLSITSIIERGIDLAAEELARLDAVRGREVV